MHSSTSLFTAFALFLSLALAAPTGIKVTNQQGLNYATSTNLNKGIYRDGGGGGCVNGLCVVGFSDTTVCNGDFLTSGTTALSSACKAVGGQYGFNSFQHNTFATFDAANARGGQPIPPNQLYDYGTHNGANGQFPSPVLGAVTPEESAMTNKFAIWPNANMVPLNAGIAQNEVVGVFNALETDNTQGGSTLYNTLAKVTVTTDVASGKTMTATRIVPSLFTKDENLYGTYSVMQGHNDGYFYLFARSGSGIGPSDIKAARVQQSTLTDKSKYQYWDGSTWSATQPSPSDTKSNIINASSMMDTGEIFWSEHFACYVHVSSSFGGFSIAYSDSITSGWSAPQDLYKAEIPDSIKSGSTNNLIYAGHSYPDWDPSGKSLLLSWTVDEMWTQMAVVDLA